MASAVATSVDALVDRLVRRSSVAAGVDRQREQQTVKRTPFCDKAEHESQSSEEGSETSPKPSKSSRFSLARLVSINRGSRALPDIREMLFTVDIYAVRDYIELFNRAASAARAYTLPVIPDTVCISYSASVLSSSGVLLIPDSTEGALLLLLYYLQN